MAFNLENLADLKHELFSVLQKKDFIPKRYFLVMWSFQGVQKALFEWQMGQGPWKVQGESTWSVKIDMFPGKLTEILSPLSSEHFQDCFHLLK